MNRDHQHIMRPDPDKVQEMISRGAALLLNQVESLAPGVLALVDTIQNDFGVKSSANLYLSHKQRQGFDSHCDRHDVFAVQVYGTKRWNIYRGQLDNPIEHAMFQNIPQIEYDRLKGPVSEVVETGPGDVLYLPRGRFHDAVATSDLSVHLSLSCNEPNGLDWLTRLWSLAVRDSAYRTALPRPDGPAGEEALERHLRQLYERLGDIAFDSKGLQIAKNMRRGYGIKRGEYRLPDTGPLNGGDGLVVSAETPIEGRRWPPAARYPTGGGHLARRGGPGVVIPDAREARPPRARVDPAGSRSRPPGRRRRPGRPTGQPTGR